MFFNFNVNKNIHCQGYRSSFFAGARKTTNAIPRPSIIDFMATASTPRIPPINNCTTSMDRKDATVTITRTKNDLRILRIVCRFIVGKSFNMQENLNRQKLKWSPHFSKLRAEYNNNCDEVKDRNCHHSIIFRT